MGFNPTLDPNAALALYLPRGQAIFRNLESSIIQLSRIEAIIAGRKHFHGVLEFVTGTDGAQVIYTDGLRATILLTPGLSARVREFEDLAGLEGRVSLYPLEANLARMATVFSTAQAMDIGDTFMRVGFQGAFKLLLEEGSSGVLHLVSALDNAQVFLDEGQVIHLQSSTLGANPEQPLSLEHLAKNFTSLEVRCVMYQTKAPLNPLGPRKETSVNERSIRDTSIRDTFVQERPTKGTVFAPAKTNTAAILVGWGELMRRACILAQQQGITAFDRAWRAAGVAHCERHPLLDPFAAELVWTDGTFTLHSDSSQGLLEALTAGFVHTLASLGLPLEPVLIRAKLVDLTVAYPEAGLERLLPVGQRRG